MVRLAERIAELRSDFFVGRKAERELLRELLGGCTPFRVLYVHGVSGMGKSALLRAFAKYAEGEGWQVVALEARALSPSVDALLDTVCPAGEDDVPRLLLLDGFQCGAEDERALRERILPAMPESSRLVFSGRKRLDTAWHTDPAWSQLVRVVELGALGHSEVADYLQRRQVRQEVRQRVIDLAGGHPLALALATDAAIDGRAIGAHLRDEPQLVHALVRDVLDEVPNELHLRALATSVIALHTTEELLASVVDAGSAQVLFEWLRSRSYMRPNARGIYPHEVLRSPLLAELQWRSPQLFGELLVSVGSFLVVGFGQHGNEGVRLQGAHDALFWGSHVHGWVCQDGFRGGQEVAPLTGEQPDVEAIVANHYGPVAVVLFRKWRDHPACRTFVLRRGTDPLEGFFSVMDLSRLTVDEMEQIPGAAALWDAYGPFSKPALYVWMWADARAGTNLSSTQMHMLMRTTELWLSARESCLVGSVVRLPTDWPDSPVDDMTRVLPDLVFEHEGQRYGIAAAVNGSEPALDKFYRGFRNMVGLLTNRFAHRPIAGSPAPSSGELREHLKVALKTMKSPDLLARSPLFELQVVRARVAKARGDLERSQAFSAYLVELAQAFRRSPRDDVYFRVLERAFFNPMQKQRAAADELGMAYSTYRRHKATAVQRLAAILQQEELLARDAEGTRPGLDEKRPSSG